MQLNKQNETPAHYEQKPDEVKPDYTPQTTYEPQSTGREQTSDRRGFLKRTGAAIVFGLGGILFGKKALADGIDGVVGEEEGLKKVTKDYDGNNGQEYDEKVMCEPNPGPCQPCQPKYDPDCTPNRIPKDCHPNCGPHS